jgi:hypothetical protein
MKDCPSDETETGDEGNHDGQEYCEAPAGSDAAPADEGLGDEPFERLRPSLRLRRKWVQRFRRG